MAQQVAIPNAIAEADNVGVRQHSGGGSYISKRTAMRRGG